MAQARASTKPCGVDLSKSFEISKCGVQRQGQGTTTAGYRARSGIGHGVLHTYIPRYLPKVPTVGRYHSRREIHRNLNRSGYDTWQDIKRLSFRTSN